MTDPVAEAAAQIAAQSAPAEPGILTEIVDEFKQLGEKIEHMIHPDAPGNASVVAEASATVVAIADAPAVAQVGEQSPAVDVGSAGQTAETAAISPAVDGVMRAAAEVPNAAPIEPAGAATPAAGDAPNVAAGAAEQPAMVPSVPAASMLVGTVGSAVSSADSIRAHLAAIKQHLSIRGFEQSAVADIHAELDAIEKWL